MTNTAVRPPVVIFDEPKRTIRYRAAALVLALVAAVSVAVGVGSLDSSSQLPVQWNHPTNLEELIERGFMPAGSAGIAESGAKWAIPTSIDDLIESGFDPAS